MFALNSLRPLLRVTLRALLLLTTLSNPILATVGDLHDTFAVIDKAHPGAISTSTAASAVGAEEHDEGPMDLFHALIHGAHCCGHLIAILQITVALKVFKTSATTLHAHTASEPDGHPFELNRPPITA